MKRLILFLLVPVISFGQTKLSIPSHPGVFATYSGYPVQSNGNVDWTKERTTSGCTCSIQDAYNNGNTITDAFGNQTWFGAGNTAFISSGSTQGALSFIGSSFTLSLKDPMTFYYANIRSKLWLTASRIYDLPDEDGTFMLNQSKMHLNIYNPFTSESSNFQFNGFQARDGSGFGVASLINLGGTAYLRMKDGFSGFECAVRANNLTRNDTVNLPNNSGTLLCNNTGSYFIPVIAATTITIPHGMVFIPSTIDVTMTSFLPSGGQWKRGVITSTFFNIDFSVPQTGIISLDFMCHP